MVRALLPRQGPVSRLAERLFPWTPREQRHRDIAESRRGRQDAQAKLVVAQAARDELTDMVYERNHFADLVASTLGLSPAQFQAVLRKPQGQ